MLLWANVGSDANTDGDGVIVVPHRRVGMRGGKKKIFDWDEDIGQFFVLAITLRHELVHAEQHSGPICAKRHVSNLYGDTVGYRLHEIEGWTKG